MTHSEFYDYFFNVDPAFWEMTEIQREIWKNEIFGNWDRYKYILRWDSTSRHFKALHDIARMGGALFLIAEQYGTGKSIIANTHNKIWQVMMYRLHKVLHPPHVYFKRIQAREHIKASPRYTAHSIDEEQRDSGSGSRAIIKHLLNLYETIRKTGRLAQQVGVNVKPGELGRAVAMYIMPMGFNRDYQANRFIVKSYKDSPMWLAVTQRNYLPHEQVYYGDRLGTWAEYEQIATEFSSSSSGIYSARNSQQEADYVNILITWVKKEFPEQKLTMPALKGFARGLDFDIAIEEQLDEVVAMAAAYLSKEQKGNTPTPNSVKVTAEGWKGLRENLEKITDEVFAGYHVPDTPLESHADMVEKFNLPILPDSLGKQLRQRRRRLTPKQLADISEPVVASWLEILGARWSGGSGGKADVLCSLGDKEIALNVKLTLKQDFREALATSPECNYQHAFAVLLIPRRLEVRVFPITDCHMTLNRTKGILAEPRSLATIIIKELVG